MKKFLKIAFIKIRMKGTKLRNLKLHNTAVDVVLVLRKSAMATQLEKRNINVNTKQWV
jgi:hypothetical protein